MNRFSLILAGVAVLLLVASGTALAASGGKTSTAQSIMVNLRAAGTFAIVQHDTYKYNTATGGHLVHQLSGRNQRHQPCEGCGQPHRFKFEHCSPIGNMGSGLAIHQKFGIEVWHKVLTSGGRIEARQRETADRLRRGLAVSRVIAWRILYATLRSRALPEAPCTALLEPEDWQALSCAIHLTPTPPATPPTLRQAVHGIGRLGGFLARRRDGEPGVTVLWRGVQQLTDLTPMYRIMRPPLGKRQNVGNA